MAKDIGSRTSLRNKAMLIALGVFVTIILIESGMRMGGFVMLSMQEHRNRVSLSRKSSYIILCVGESTTQGQYPRFLKGALESRNKAITFAVVDKGTMGMNTHGILNQIERSLDRYAPDIVVAMMGINDRGKHMPYEAYSSSGLALFLRSLKTYKLARFLGMHIATKAGKSGLFRPWKGNGSFKETLPIDLEPPSNNPPKERAFLKKIMDLSSADNEAGFGRAEEFLNKAIALNPENESAYVALGWLYRIQGKFGRSEEVLKKAIALNPENESAYVALGWLYRIQGKFGRSEEALIKVIEINPRNYLAYVVLGWLYEGQGRFGRAEEALKKAIGLMANNHWAYVTLGWLYRTRGRFSEAEEMFREAISKNPQDERLYGALASLYEETGQSERALEYSMKADQLRTEELNSVTSGNYLKLKGILDRRNIILVCVQYPMQSISPLKKIFGRDNSGVIFVDNGESFRENVKKEGYREYFRDMFGGDFGHCTDKGNRLLAGNIASAILEALPGLEYPIYPSEN